MRRLVVLAVLLAACSSGSAAPRPLPVDPAVAVDGVLVVPSLARGADVIDLDRTDDPVAALPQELPEQGMVVEGGGRRAVVQLARGGSVGSPVLLGGARFRSDGRDAAFQRGVGCRPRVLIEDHGLVTVAADGWSRRDLASLARHVHVRRDRLSVDPDVGWRVVARLPSGWARSPAGSIDVAGGPQAYDQRGAVVVPLGGSARAVLDQSLCRELVPLRTGTSGMTVLPQRAWERRTTLVDGRRVTVGKLSPSGLYVVTTGVRPARAVFVSSYEVPPTPEAVARLALEAAVEPVATFDRRREDLVARSIAEARAAAQGLLDLAGKEVYASGRDGGLAWTLASVFRRGAGRIDDPAACLTIVRSATGNRGQVTDQDCIEAAPAPDPLRMAAAGPPGVVDHVWGTTDRSVASVELTVDGWTHQVPTVDVGRAGLGRVFVAAVPARWTRAAGSWPRAVLEGGPIRIRGLRADGTVAVDIRWGGDACPASPSAAC